MPLAFDAQGIARPTDWRMKKDRGELSSDQPRVESKPTLHLRADQGESVGSWRTKLLLEEGRYCFQALARVAQVAALTNKVERGNGAGIRISGGKRTNELTGDL